MFKYPLYFGVPSVMKACFRFSSLSNIVSMADCLAQSRVAL